MNKMLAKVGTKLTKIGGKAGLVLQKKSPEILLAAGVVGFVGTVVLACRATLKADDILDKYEEQMKKIDRTFEVAEEHEDEEYDVAVCEHDRKIQKIKTAAEFVKLYAPSLALGAVSVGCILASRNILQKRYLGAVAAYNAVSEAFQTYRQRVVDEQGEKMDRHFRYGTTYGTTTEEIVDENGKTKKQKVDTEDTNLTTPSEQAVIFDESNPNWDKNPQFAMMFLRSQQNYLNDRLQTKGHVFLNEVYDALGFPHTQAGSVLGWVLGAGDDFIDFGLYNLKEESVRRFVNGQDNIVLLDFNHDGVIWDKI